MNEAGKVGLKILHVYKTQLVLCCSRRFLGLAWMLNTVLGYVSPMRNFTAEESEWSKNICPKLL